MIRRLVFIAVVFCVCLGSQALAQPLLKTDKLELRLQNRLYAGAMHPADGVLSGRSAADIPAHDYFRDDAARSLPGDFLTVTANRLCGFRTYELSRLGCALKGAETGATLGMFLGAVGNTTGMWNERSSWFLVGATTALGAILGGTSGAENPAWRIQITHDEP